MHLDTLAIMLCALQECLSETPAGKEAQLTLKRHGGRGDNPLRDNGNLHKI